MSAANQLLEDSVPGIGHNMPPLDDVLTEILAPFVERGNAMLEVAKTAIIIDKASAEKVLDLERLFKGLDKDLEERREEMKRPFLEACRQIDRQFGAVSGPLRVARLGDNGRGGLRGMIDTWTRRQEEIAAAERQRLLAEQRQREAEAEAARRAAEENRARGSINIGDELAVLQAEEAARRLGDKAAATRPDPLRSHRGQVGQQRQITFQITDLRKLLGWMLRQAGLKAKVEQGARTIIGTYLRGLGVDTVARGVEIPGLEASVEKTMTVR